MRQRPHLSHRDFPDCARLACGRSAGGHAAAGAAMSAMDVILRQAHSSDIPGMQRVRDAVRENRLVSLVIPAENYLQAIESTGRGWVIESGGEVVAFAVGNAQTGNIWALFVDPAHERRGFGRRLHDTMVEWLWSVGLERLHLSTSPGTRAERFYDIAGWRRAGTTPDGEVAFELRKSAPSASGPSAPDAAGSGNSPAG